MTAGSFQAVRADIGALNGRILKTVAHPKHGPWARRHWGVQDKVAELIEAATTAHIECIAGCGAPAFQVRVPVDPAVRSERVPQRVAQLHLWVLLSVMRAARADDVAAVILFRSPPEALARLCSWPFGTVRDAAFNHGDVVQVGRMESATFWRNVLIGARLGGDIGTHLVRTHLLMGTEETE